MNAKLKRLTWWMLVALLLTGCSAMTRGQVFDVALHNVGARNLSHAVIEFDGYYIDVGYLRSNIDASELLVDANWPTLAIARWRFDGESTDTPLHETTVQVPQVFPEKYPQDRHSLNFQFDGTHVTARIEVVLAQPTRGRAP